MRRVFSTPNGRLSVNWNSPHATGLVAAYNMAQPNGSQVYNLVNGRDALVLSGNAAFGSYRGGTALLGANTGTSTGAILTAPSASLQPADAVSVFWRGSINSGGTIANNPPLVVMYHNNANTSPFTTWGLLRRSTGANLLGATYNGAIMTASAIDTTQYGIPMSAMMSRRNGATRLYKDGLLVASDNGAAAITYGATCQIRINTHVTTTTDRADCHTQIVYIWSRIVTDDESKAIHADPYSLLVPTRAAKYFVPPSPNRTGTSAVTAPAATLTASGTVVHTYTGTSAVTAAAATLTASGTVVNPAAGFGSNFQLLGIG